MEITTREQILNMNEIKFRKLSSEEQVLWVNQRLQDTGNKVEEVAKEISISSSSLSSLMKEGGCRYSRAKKQYVSIEVSQQSKKANQEEFLNYLVENAGIIHKIIDESSSKQLVFDSSIYQTDDTFTSKTVKIKTNTLDEFQTLLKDKYPQFRFQDMLTQAIIDFTKKYK
ncbi:hypothetical protein ON064_03095 [Planococcus sp. A6]|uniref:hypothetical protein n=1 Tax=Planococcus sp. A6 TaxID=2992760 RepID=UPI00237B6CB3|nr:hypothetical protein [Planococcus sp. A6]MDE0582031.1 hypothetical protein [Planococcus sp. A6]